MTDEPTMREPTPTTLEGYQSLRFGMVLENDLAIPDYAMGSPDWLWAEDARIDGLYTSSLGTCDGYRVYRINPVVRKLDGCGSCVDPTSIPSPPKALTHDEGKAPLAWLPWEALNEMAMVQEYGHKKYGSFLNYKKGMEVSRHLSCAIRHIRDYMSGIDKDHESGCNPLAHAMIRLAYVIDNLHHGVAIDDRNHGPQNVRYVAPPHPEVGVSLR